MDTPPRDTFETTSFCRICTGTCALRLTIEDGRITRVRGVSTNLLIGSDRRAIRSMRCR